MATKADQFKADTQRAAQAGAGAGNSSDQSKQAKAATTRSRQVKRRGDNAPLPRPALDNQAPRLAKNSVYELEPSATGRPSRKSTRRSPTHVKTDSPLRITAVSRHTSPQARAQRAAGHRVAR